MGHLPPVLLTVAVAPVEPAGGNDRVESASWSAARPAASVVVSTFRRPSYLAGLLAALGAQHPPAGGFEVVLVDNGSGDDTWPALAEAVASSTLPMVAVRLDRNRGPGGGRNVGVGEARGGIVAFTDDDCLPTPGWLTSVVAAFGEPGVDVVQGPVVPDPEGEETRGPWDHTIDIGGPTPWFETSNVAYRRAAFEAVGGFDETDRLTAQSDGGRAFGEDSLVGWRVIEAGGGRGWAGPDGVVHHRIVPATLRDRFHAWSMVEGFPGLAVRSGVVRDSMVGGVFLNRETARYDLAAASVVAAVVARHPLPLLGVVPWARRRWPGVRQVNRSRGRAALALGQLFAVEGWGLLHFLRGSVIHRKVVL